VSLFGRREKRRIAVLEEQLRDAIENLAVASIPMGHPAMTQKIQVREGQWYRVAYMVRYNGTQTLDLKDMFVGIEDPSPVYFDSTTVSPARCGFSWWSPGFGERIECDCVGKHEIHRGPGSSIRDRDRSAAFVRVGLEDAVPDGRWAQR
jgi:hypothetical protein